MQYADEQVLVNRPECTPHAYIPDGVPVASASTQIVIQPLDEQFSTRSLDVGTVFQQIQMNNEAMDIIDTQPNLQEPVLNMSPERRNFPSNTPRPSYSEMQNRERLWTTFVGDLNIPSFDKPLQVRKIYTNRSTPKDYFLDMFPESMINLIVENTNIYANEKRSHGWQDVTKEEISAYLGMMILMSINPISDSQLYWSTDVFYKNPIISGVMTLRRFKKITENFHISDIRTELPKTSPNYDKLCKIQPLIQKLNQTFAEACTSSQTQSIDESMIKFKGKSTMKQYMPKKPIKRGYKCWARCDSKSGYLFQFQFYTGKVGNTSEENLGYRVVLDLADDVPENTLLVFDNFFTSLGLMTALFEKKIFSIGTVRINRKGLPELITKKSRETTLKPGEFIYQYSAPLSVLKWRDTKDVFVCTTAFNPKDIIEIKRTQKDGSKKNMFCPLAIKKYTEFMGGVDLFDHYRSSYPVGRKSRKNWHRIFWFLLEAAIINSYIVYMTTHSIRRNTHKEFRLRLARALIDNFSSRKKQAAVFKTKKGGCYGVPDETRLSNVGLHMPRISKYRRCRFCSTRAKEQRTKYSCSICLVSLCAAPCFENYHSTPALSNM